MDERLHLTPLRAEISGEGPIRRPLSIPIRPLTVLGGRNESGKSSALELLASQRRGSRWFYSCEGVGSPGHPNRASFARVLHAAALRGPNGILTEDLATVAAATEPHEFLAILERELDRTGGLMREALLADPVILVSEPDGSDDPPRIAWTVDPDSPQWQDLEPALQAESLRGSILIEEFARLLREAGPEKPMILADIRSGLELPEAVILRDPDVNALCEYLEANLVRLAYANYGLQYVDPEDLNDAGLMIPETWFVDEEDGTTLLHAAVDQVSRTLASRITTFLPPTLLRQRWVSINPLTPHDVLRTGRRIEIAIGRPHLIPLQAMSYAVQRWVSFGVIEAVTWLLQSFPKKITEVSTVRETSCDDLHSAVASMLCFAEQYRESFWSEIHVQARHESSRILLIDEPERGLHPTATRELGAALQRLSSRQTAIIYATHHPALLPKPNPDAGLVLLEADPEGHIAVRSIGAELLPAFDDLTASLGLDPHDLLEPVRGVLAVEGEHDKRVIEMFFARELVSAGVLILPMRGIGGARAIAEGEFVNRLGKPIAFLLDNVFPDLLREDLLGERRAPRSAEERIADHIHRLRKREGGPPVAVVPFPEPDIWTALPLEGVRRAFPAAHAAQRFNDWTEVLESLTEGEDWKQRVMRALGIPKRTTGNEFVERVLANADGLRPAPSLGRAVREALAWLEDQAQGTG